MNRPGEEREQVARLFEELYVPRGFRFRLKRESPPIFDRLRRFLQEKDGPKMLNFNSIMLGTMQTKAMVSFYEGVIGKPADMVDRENGFYGWQVGSSYFSVLEQSQMAGKTKDPGRVLMNFETAQVKEEFERIKALGAEVIRAPYQMGNSWLATLADPDGNYFQLVTPM